MMQTRLLGQTTIAVAPISFGCGAIGGLFILGQPADQRRAFERAIELGVTYFDTAANYGDGVSETNLGRVWREVRPSAGISVGTKARLNEAEMADIPAALRRSLEGSLRRLQMDRVDLFQLHNQVALDANVGGTVTVAQVVGPIADGLRAVKAAGLCRHVGFTATGEPAAIKAIAAARVFETAQCYYNALNPSGSRWPAPANPDGGIDFDGAIDALVNEGVGVMAIRALAAGAVSATPDRHPLAGNPGGPLVPGAEYQRDVARAQRLRPLAAEWGCENTVELALRFVVSNPNIATAMAGVSDLAQFEAQARWVAKGPLSVGQALRVACPAP